MANRILDPVFALPIPRDIFWAVRLIIWMVCLTLLVWLAAGFAQGLRFLGNL